MRSVQCIVRYRIMMFWAVCEHFGVRNIELITETKKLVEIISSELRMELRKGRTDQKTKTKAEAESGGLCKGEMRRVCCHVLKGLTGIMTHSGYDQTGTVL